MIFFNDFNILGDLLGKLLALISLTPFGIGAGFFTLILFRRDMHTVSTKFSVISTHFYSPPPL